MTETPDLEGPLRNPEVSEDADRKLDKDMDRMTPAAARAQIPEFASLPKPPTPQEEKPKYQTAAEQRLPHAQAILDNLDAAQSARQEAEAAAKAGPSEERLMELLSPTSADESRSAADHSTVLHEDPMRTNVLNRRGVKEPSAPQTENQ